MNIVVCYKNVPDAEQLRIDPDGTVDLSAAAWSIGQYDMNAIEAAMDICAQAEGSQVTALTAAGEIVNDSKQRKAVLSRGPQKMLGVHAPELDGADAYATATLLAETIKGLGCVDLVIFGEGSGDVYAQQTGVLTGALLGWNTVNAVDSMELSDGKLILKRLAPDRAETLEVTLPAAICVTGSINKPRIPTLKDILAAGKKPFEVIEPSAEMRCGTQALALTPTPQSERRQIVFEAPDEDAYTLIVRAIKAVQ